MDQDRPTYHSYKKKYRKMRIKFDEVMRQSNALLQDEQRALDTAKRLAQDNDRLLDMLLDLNRSARMPSDKRIDLLLESPEVSAIPPLVRDEDVSAIATVEDPTCQAIYKELRGMLAERQRTVEDARPPKSLASLLSSIPHLSTTGGGIIPPDLLATLAPPEGSPAPPSFLTPDQIDDYLYEIDATLGPKPGPPPQKQSVVSPQELAIRNPLSVYNWLRRHEPRIFLQDGEGGNEKSSGRPGALRGAGKRSNMPAPSHPDALEFVEEDGIGYDPSVTGSTTKGKRKRDPDDEGYTPKGPRIGEDGKVKKRPYVRKKKPDGTPNEATPAKKGRGKGGRSSMASAVDASSAGN
ncbi:IEC3 subunit of the Ino80 complex, chromatin re-modelling-domain-containing protein [Xylogone sp. PMI_703]|nr:IEC3 subunit of the Ino80 complex, chromatin re-modelling-domain-containing protein [Xylogone sp. PMI_703]